MTSLYCFRLSISGQHLEPRLPPVDTSRLEFCGDDDTFSPYEREDIFEQDGFVEDIIAIDYKSPWVSLTLEYFCWYHTG